MEEGEGSRTNQLAASQASPGSGGGGSVKQWQGHPPPGGGGAGRPPASARKISPAQQALINKTPESNRTRKSPTPELCRVRKSPTPPDSTRMRKSPSPVPSIGRRGSPKKTTKSPSPKGSPQKSRTKASPEPEKPKKSSESSQPELEGSHFARPTIIESAEDPGDPGTGRDFTRSVSEPHGGSERDTENLTGMFFQKLILKEDGGTAGAVYQSNSSLTSQDSCKSGQSRGSLSPRPGATKQLQSSKNQPGTPSPNLSAKYGSGETMFSINKHQKVDLASFDHDQNTSTPR